LKRAQWLLRRLHCVAAWSVANVKFCIALYEKGSSQLLTREITELACRLDWRNAGRASAERDVVAMRDFGGHQVVSKSCFGKRCTRRTPSHLKELIAKWYVTGMPVGKRKFFAELLLSASEPE
jgi:hypothetical protein